MGITGVARSSIVTGSVSDQVLWRSDDITQPTTEAAWNVAWETGGPNLMAFGFREDGAGATPTFFSDIVVLKHPLDY